MDLVFLSADKPIVKAYEINALGELVKHPYPFIYEVSSIIESCNDIEDMHTAIKRHAAQSNCLLKGRINRPLVKESRAGSTNSNDTTNWLCLDLDGIEGYETLDLVLEDYGLADTDYIVQWSSSMGIENHAGMRCHVFVLLNKEYHPELIKHWLMSLNLSLPKMASQLSLTKTGNSLSWPLDITTCQNDKLLYIAAPNLGAGIEDPFASKPRISLVKKKKRTFTLPFPIPSRDVLRHKIDEEVNRLRESAGMAKRRASKYKYQGTTEYMAKPDTATITGVKEERGFVYLNLNGGDSWAYYHPSNNPFFIHNFKGEPTYKTEELLPAYWAQLRQKAQSYEPSSDGLIYLAFRDFRTSNYYNGTFDPTSNQLNLAQAKSETQLRHFMVQHGQPFGDFVPDWNIIWDPHTPVIIDTQNQTLNTYQPSDYYLNKPYPKVNYVPSTIHKILDHVLGNDPATYEYFINWLACIIQLRTRTGTAWVLQGTQGTGKGVLFHKIITPLLGEQNVVSKRMEELESEFTGFMENKFVVFIDEIEAGNSMYHNKITAKLKNLIVEPTISIRKMYSPPYMAPNYANQIFASNKGQAVEIAPDDRRFNVGVYQKNPIQLTATEIDVDILNELPSFFGFLMHYPADPNKARTPLASAARATLMDISRTAIDRVSDALLAGDLEFLWNHLPADSSSLAPITTYKFKGFRDLMIDAVTNNTSSLTRDELYLIYDWCVGNMSTSPHKFTALLKHHRISLSIVHRKGRDTPGITVNWQCDPTWLTKARQEIANGII